MGEPFSGAAGAAGAAVTTTTTADQWSGKAPMDGTFLIGSIHPPQWFTNYHPKLERKLGYILTPEQIDQLIARVKTSRVAVTVEHKAVTDYLAVGHAALKTKPREDEVIPTEVVLEQIFEIAKVDPAADVVGQVVDMFQVPGGATYAVLFLPSMFDNIVWLVENCGYGSLSLTHGNSPDPTNTEVVPYEVTICKRPARPNCNISYISTAKGALGPWDYKRQLLEGGITDTSWWSPQVDFVMAASAQAVQEMGAKTTTTTAAAEPVNQAKPEAAAAADAPKPADEAAVKKAVMSITEEADRRTVVASMTALVGQSRAHQARADQAEKHAAEQAEKLKALEDRLANAQMQKRAHACSIKIFQSELGKMRKNLRPEILEAYQLNEAETDAAFGDTTDDAPGRQLEVLQRYVTACNFNSMMNMSAEAVSNDRNKRARVDDTAVASPADRPLATAPAAAPPASGELDQMFAASSAALRASQNVHQVGTTAASAGSMDVESAAGPAGPARSEAEIAHDQIFNTIAGMSYHTM